MGEDEIVGSVTTMLSEDKTRDETAICLGDCRELRKAVVLVLLLSGFDGCHLKKINLSVKEARLGVSI
jgi:hypothetical protein